MTREVKPHTAQQVLYIAESSLGFHKVGISKHPEKRLAQISIPGVLELRLLHTVPLPFARKAERFVHEALRDYRVSTEWFKLPEDVVTTLCECEGEHDLLALFGAFVA